MVKKIVIASAAVLALLMIGAPASGAPFRER